MLNEATQRKSSSAAGFNSQGERVYGNEAQNLLGKLPAQQFVLSKLLLGATSADAAEVKSLAENRYPYIFENDAAGHGAILRYSKNETYRPEEMVAFVLSYAKQIAEGHAKSSVKDCVITIPPHFGHLERHAMMNAATIAGLNVLSLIHEPTAFAFKFGFDKESDFTAEPTNVVFYDLGATSYKVSVASFSTTVGKKNKTQGAMQVKGVAWDRSLGGQNFDAIVLDMLAEEFNKVALKGKDDVRKYPKAVGKLRKSAESTKDILSANKNYQVGVEALHDDRDLRMLISREAFEQEAERRGLWARLVPPLEAALAQANLTKEEIHRVEVVGGATRILRVKQTALEFFGRKQLDGSLNGDEAAALGATLFAAKLSTSFRLREFAINDVYPHAASIRITGQSGEAVTSESEDGEDGGKASGKGKPKLLFKMNSKMPHKKLISMTRTDDLLATLTLGEPDDAASGSPMATFNVTGVAAAYARMQKDENRKVLSKPKVSITFALSTSGLIDVSKAEMSIELLEKYEDFEMVPDPNATVNAIDSDESAAEAAVNSSSSNSTNATAMIKVKVEKERKRLHYVTLKVAKEVQGAATPITPSVVQECISRNAELLRQEQIRRTNAEAKNALESFIIDTRDKMSDESVEQVSTEEEREAIRSKFDTMEEWIYEDGQGLEASAYHAKKRELTSLTSPIFLRHAELEARPKAAATAREAVNWTMTILDTWATERPEITEEERKRVSGMCANFTEWLDASEAEQAKLPLTSPPAFRSTEVNAKLEPIETEVRKLIRKPKPKPPKVSKNATSAANSTSPGNGTAAESSSSADDSKEEGEKAEKEEL